MQNFDENSLSGVGERETYDIISLDHGETGYGNDDSPPLAKCRSNSRNWDEEGRAAQEKLNALAMREYEQTGTLSSLPLAEAAAEYEKLIETHVLDRR